MWETQFICKCGNQHNLVIEKEEYILVGEPLVFICPVINKRIMFFNGDAWTEKFELDNADIKVSEIKKR